MRKFRYFFVAVAMLSLCGCSLQEASDTLAQTSKKLMDQITNPTQQTNTDPSTAVDMQTSKICKAWRENEVAADREYKDKHARFKGKVTQISRDYIGLDVGDDYIAYMVRSSKDDPAQLKKGQIYYVTGYIISMTYNYSSLKGCNIAIGGTSITPAK